MALFCEMSRSIGMGDVTALKEKRQKQKTAINKISRSERVTPERLSFSRCVNNIMLKGGSKAAFLTYLVE